MTTTNNRNDPDADDWKRDIVEEPDAAMLKAAPVPGREEMRVKPLEWERITQDHWQAETLGLKYVVVSGRWREGGCGYISADIGNDAAKAAAQADYETRIRSALFAAQPASDDALAKMTAERDAALKGKSWAQFAKEQSTAFTAALAERDALREALKSIAFLRPAKPAAEASGSGEPVAWTYELATTVNTSTGERGGWKPYLSWSKPHVPHDALRNLSPLYATPPAPATVEMLREAIGDAIEKLNQYRGAAVDGVIDDLDAALAKSATDATPTTALDKPAPDGQ